MKHNLRNAIAYLPQLWDWLKNERNKDNKILKRVWKAVKKL